MDACSSEVVVARMLHAPMSPWFMSLHYIVAYVSIPLSPHRLDEINKALHERPFALFSRRSSIANDDRDVRELVDRLQKYHDVVEKEFTGQKVRNRPPRPVLYLF